eukprot:2223177-Pyramimonas_sp.AAC.1
MNSSSAIASQGQGPEPGQMSTAPLARARRCGRSGSCQPRSLATLDHVVQGVMLLAGERIAIAFAVSRTA